MNTDNINNLDTVEHMRRQLIESSRPYLEECSTVANNYRNIAIMNNNGSILLELLNKINYMESIPIEELESRAWKNAEDADSIDFHRRAVWYDYWVSLAKISDDDMYRQLSNQCIEQIKTLQGTLILLSQYTRPVLRTVVEPEECRQLREKLFNKRREHSCVEENTLTK